MRIAQNIMDPAPVVVLCVARSQIIWLGTGAAPPFCSQLTISICSWEQQNHAPCAPGMQMASNLLSPNRMNGISRTRGESGWTAFSRGGNSLPRSCPINHVHSKREKVIKIRFKWSGSLTNYMSALFCWRCCNDKFNIYNWERNVNFLMFSCQDALNKC